MVRERPRPARDPNDPFNQKIADLYLFDRTIQQIADEVGFSPRNVRQRLRFLRDAGVDLPTSRQHISAVLEGRPPERPEVHERRVESIRVSRRNPEYREKQRIGAIKSAKKRMHRRKDK